MDRAEAPRRRGGGGGDPERPVRWFTGDRDIHAQHADELWTVMHQMTTDGLYG